MTLAISAKVWAKLPRGKVEVNGVVAATGDGIAIADETVLHIIATEEAELVLVDTA